MNRHEYRKTVKNKFTGPGWIYYWNHIDFTALVRSVAVELFYQNDFDSELAIETRRRLKQLQTGETDE